MAGHIASSNSHDWCTPDWVIEGVRTVFGGSIALDPCSNQHSRVNAVEEFRLPEKDGLKEAWRPDRVYLNPPFGRVYMHQGSKVCLTQKEWGCLPLAEKASYTSSSIADWVKKAAQHGAEHGKVIALIPAAVGTSHWQRYVLRLARYVCFVRGRMKFRDPNLEGVLDEKGQPKKPGPAPMDCALVYWGRQAPAFLDVFTPHGVCLNLAGEG